MRQLFVFILAAITLLGGGCSTDSKDKADDANRIRVESGTLRDGQGRVWLPRGFNARILGLFDVTFDDGRIPLEDIPDFTAADARLAVQYGFNYLRLPINWSGLEPHEGQFSEVYLARLDEVIGFCRDAGLKVVIDFHQDAYSKEIGEDGAPLWAIVPPPTELLEGPLDDLTERRFSDQVFNAFTSFFQNVEGVRDRFMPAWTLIVKRYKDEPAVIGFEPMNEPVSVQADATHGLLYEFYERCAQVMTDNQVAKPLWLEPDSVRNLIGVAPLRTEPFPFPQVVYYPHLYPVALDATNKEAVKSKLRISFEAMRAEAASWGAALVLGEWGANPASESDFPYVRAVQDLCEEVAMGQTLWLWKEISQGYWGLFDYDAATDTWTPRESGIKEFSQPYAPLTPGSVNSHTFDEDAAELAVRFETTGGESAPVLYLPATWMPAGPVVTLNGVELAVTVDPATGLCVVPWEGQAGTFELKANPRPWRG